MDYFNEYIEEVRAVKTLADCDYILGKVALLDAEIDEINESVNTQIERVKLWQESRIASIEKQKQYFLPSLHAYILSKEKKTIKLVNGSLVIRKQQDEIIIDDNEAVISDGRFIKEKVSVSIDKSKLKQYLLETGEIIDGVTVNSREPKFSYKITN